MIYLENIGDAGVFLLAVTGVLIEFAGLLWYSKRKRRKARELQKELHRRLGIV